MGQGTFNHKQFGVFIHLSIFLSEHWSTNLPHSIFNLSHTGVINNLNYSCPDASEVSMLFCDYQLSSMDKFLQIYYRFSA